MREPRPNALRRLAIASYFSLRPLAGDCEDIGSSFVSANYRLGGLVAGSGQSGAKCRKAKADLQYGGFAIGVIYALL